MSKLSHIQLLIGMLLILSFTSSSFGQNKIQDVFAPVPVEFRTQLIKRFNRFFEYGRTGQWDNFYDLLYFKRASVAGREYFIKQHRKTAPKGWSEWLVEVSPESIRRNDGSMLNVDWIVVGSVKSLEQKHGTNSFRVGAIFRNGKWFFSELSFGGPRIVCTPILVGKSSQ